MTLHLKDTILRIGNHIIAPAGTKPVPVSPAPPPPPFPTLNPDDLLALAFEIQAKLLQLERLVDQRKTQRNDDRNSVKSLKKTLASLKDEESKEDEKLAKLNKQLIKRSSVFGSHRDGNRNHNSSSYYPSRRTSSALLPVSRGAYDENPFICPTTKAASAFNGNSDRYRDTYTFAGPAWTKYPSPIAEATYDASSPNHPKGNFFDEGVLYTLSPRSSADDEDDYTSIAASSPTASPTPRGVFADVRNVQMQGNDGRGRKRKSSGDFEEGGSWEKKKMRYGEASEYGSATDGSGRRRSRRFSSARR